MNENIPHLVDMNLLRRWQFAIRLTHKAHIKASAAAERLNRAIGIPVVILSTITGTTIFASIDNSPSMTAKITVGLLSVTAAVLASLQTWLNYSGRAERHRSAALQYGSLRRIVEELLATFSDDHPCPSERLREIRECWDGIDSSAPALPQKIYMSVEADVRSKGKREKVDQESQ
jgi:hypothetical protein